MKSFRMPLRRIALLLAATLIHLPALAGELIPYRVQPGDTLYDVSARHLQSASDWRLVARINKIGNPKRLVPGSTLLLPASRLLGTMQPATVVYVRGSVTTRTASGAPARSLSAGDTLEEGVSVHVGPASFATLRLFDGSTVQFESNTDFTLQRLREVPRIQRRDSVIRLDSGRIDSTVSPQRKGSRFDVRTPLAVAGVRGTRFGVSVQADGKKVLSEVVEGHVAVAANNERREAQLSAGHGAALTDVPGSLHVRALLPAPAVAIPSTPYERLPITLPIAAVPGAGAYRLRIAQDRDGQQVRVSQPAATPPLTVAALPDGEYFLAVRAIDADGLMGAETAVAFRVKTTPVPPLVQSPMPGQVFGPGPVQLRCTAVPGATGYVLQVSRDGRFESTVVQQSNGGTCRFTLELVEPGEYHWRVATVIKDAKGGDDRGPFSDPSRFVVVPEPEAPTLSIGQADPSQIHWAGKAGDRYQVQVAADIGFAEIVRDFEVKEPRARLDLPAGCRPYFVRLRTLGAHGLQSPFSPPRQLNATAGVCSSDGTPVLLFDGSGLARQPR